MLLLPVFCCKWQSQAMLSWDIINIWEELIKNVMWRLHKRADIDFKCFLVTKRLEFWGMKVYLD